MPIVKQLTILQENTPGALAKVCSDLATKNINIQAISVFDTIDSGLIRMLVSDPGHAKEILVESGFNVIETEVLAVEMTDKTGVLAEIGIKLSKARINIEYAYASVAMDKGKSLGVFWVSNLKKASEILEDQG